MALIDLIFSRAKDDSKRLTYPADYQPALEAALDTYSRHRPRLVVEDVAASGGADLDLPAGWEDEFSQMRAVEYPLGLVPPALWSQGDWALYLSPTGVHLRLKDVVPAAGELVRVTYTASRSEAQVPRADLDAVANLAAAMLCEVLANLFAHSSDPTIAADVVNYRSKSAEFAARAKRLRQMYLDQVGLRDGDPAPAMGVAIAPSTGRVRLTHGRR
ncbi:hypothetical protein [Geoalkalibacter sp.]|uniref:hypothetical protein n=1 Tax=Geoalkalibacter sp. TaxID=3041440 RepID=UPI00272ECB82|nr:hypothetical protein [Geoalkalibacter sp.]